MDSLTANKQRELDLFNQFKAGRNEFFSYFFDRYYQGLCVYAAKLTGNEQASKDIVQDFFLRIWENRRKTEICSSVRSYFIQSVHNRCLDYLASGAVRVAHFQKQLLFMREEDLLDYPLLDFELKRRIDTEIAKLPDNIRDTFKMSRFEGLNYQQIAERENISVKTVEFRISKALEYLRKGLSDYLYTFIL
ncbi:MAG: RNA polymerase sigma-70 factor [Mangrovibacterium sp.]